MLQSIINFMVFASLVLNLALVEAAFAQCGGDSYGTKRINDVMCGPKCLLFISQNYGIKADLDELAKLSGKNDSGTTLFGLSTAAEKKGLHAVGMKIGIDGLAKLKIPAIAHLWGNHFVIVEGSAEGLKVTDPSKPIKDPAKEDQSMPMDQFKVRYSGFALLISKDKSLFPKAEAKGPDIRFEKYHCDLGFLDEGAKTERAIKFRNTGNLTLAVSRVRSSCGCMVVELTDKIIPPGGEGEIKIALDTEGLQGGQSMPLYLQSNDPISPLVQVEVGVVVKPNRVLASARRINFGQVNLHDGAVREIFVRDPGDKSLQIKEIASDSQFITATLRQDSGSDGNTGRHVISLNLKPGLPIGHFATKVTIFTNHPKEQKVEIPVTALIEGDIKAFPDTFFMGLLKKGDTISKSITLSTTGSGALQIMKVDAPIDHLEVSCSPKVDGREYIIAASLKPTSPTGYLKNEVVIHTNNPDQPEIRIPVYALIQ